MTKDEALKLALEALEFDSFYGTKKQEAINAIKEALAQPEHGWTPERIAGMARLKEAQDKRLAQRTWVGLTDEEIMAMVQDECVVMRWPSTALSIARAIEAAVLEKQK